MNSISQGQNNESVVIMLKSNVEKIHKRKVVNHLLKSNVQIKGFVRGKVAQISFLNVHVSWIPFTQSQIP